MAIDNTGISSLDTGASDITYSGNEGPKSPEQEQQMMLAQLEQEYEQYRMEQIEIDPSKVLSFEDWYQSEYAAARQGVAYGGTARPTYTQARRQRINAAGGGIMGSNAGSMLVAPTADGSRPGYGILSKLKDKFVDDIIPNEIKENPMLSAAVAGLGINQFGVPFMGDTGKDWIGNLLGGAGDMLGTGARKAGTALGIPGADDWFTGGINPYSGVKCLLPPGSGIMGG